MVQCEREQFVRYECGRLLWYSKRRNAYVMENPLSLAAGAVCCQMHEVVAGGPSGGLI